MSLGIPKELMNYVAIIIFAHFFRVIGLDQNPYHISEFALANGILLKNI